MLHQLHVLVIADFGESVDTACRGNREQSPSLRTTQSKGYRLLLLRSSARHYGSFPPRKNRLRGEQTYRLVILCVCTAILRWGDTVVLPMML